MGDEFKEKLESWPNSFIRDSDLALLLDKTDDARHSLIKRLVKAGELVRLRKGFYLISSHLKKTLPDEFILAILLYEPSFVSLESALSYHNLLPEAVYTTTCVTSKRAKEFMTSVGMYSYKHVPVERFYEGVGRYESPVGVMLIAEPWRALADFIYVRKKTWKNLGELEADMRIYSEDLLRSDISLLRSLSECYPSLRVRVWLKKILREIVKNKRDIV